MKKYLICVIFLFWTAAYGAMKPEAVYLTWQHHPESTMTIHWISETARPINTVYYKEKKAPFWDSKEDAGKSLPEGMNNFLVHTAELTGLKPDTLYSFRLGEDQKVYHFRTMPKALSRPLTFVAGGDMYHDAITLLDRMNQLASDFDPMFVLAGGDLAYAADKYGREPEDFDRWLAFLRSWQKNMITTDGRQIPILPVISNEDTKGRYDQTPAQAPFFYALFSQPGKQGYNVLDFGDYLSVFLLDSGHTHPVYGYQTYWLNEALKKREHMLHKVAIYHVPAFPGVRTPNKPVSRLIRKYWVPLFEKYNLSVAFENHDHAYKRSKLIRNGKIDDSGVLYLGDGGFGVSDPRLPAKPEERWYLAKTAQKTNFVVTTLFPSGERRFQAVDSSGKIFDEFTLSPSTR